jgi:hypothetical protein
VKPLQTQLVELGSQGMLPAYLLLQASLPLRRQPT